MAKTKEQFKEALKKCENTKQFFDVCGQFYDLEGAKIGIITKGILISKIDTLITMVNAKLKP